MVQNFLAAVVLPVRRVGRNLFTFLHFVVLKKPRAVAKELASPLRGTLGQAVAPFVLEVLWLFVSVWLLTA